MKYLVVRRMGDLRPVAKTRRKRGLSTGTHVEYGSGLIENKNRPEGTGVLFAPSLIWPGDFTREEALQMLPLVEARPSGSIVVPLLGLKIGAAK